MSGLVSQGDTGNDPDKSLKASAIERVRDMLPDGFGKAYKEAKAMVARLNEKALELADDPNFRDIFTFETAHSISGVKYLTGPFEVAVLDTNWGPIINILGTQLERPLEVFHKRVDQSKIPYENRAKADDDFLKSLKRNPLPLTTTGGILSRGRLNLIWGKKAGQNFEIGETHDKYVMGVRDITKEVEALLAQQL
jgi:hypothetical protein